MGLFISIGMSFVMTFAVLAINVGFIEDFFPMWMKSWGIGFVVGFPAATVIVPLARKAVSRIAEIPV